MCQLKGKLEPVGDTARKSLPLRKVTVRRAEVLAGLADGRTRAEIAERIGISVNGVRSHIEDLKRIAECPSDRNLGRWWRENRLEWLRVLASAGAIDDNGVISVLLRGDSTVRPASRRDRMSPLLEVDHDSGLGPT